MVRAILDKFGWNCHLLDIPARQQCENGGFQQQKIRWLIKQVCGFRDREYVKVKIISCRNIQARNQYEFLSVKKDLQQIALELNKSAAWKCLAADLNSQHGVPVFVRIRR